MNTRSLRDNLALYFKQHANVWIDGDVLRQVAGKYAYRTRISDCRIDLHMTIENRLRKVPANDEGGFFTVSEYRYVPAENQGMPILRGHDMNDWGLSS